MAKRRVKRAVFAASLSLLLVAMLMAGSTMAWFSDTKVMVNTFTFGDFAVDLVHNEGGESKSIKGEKALFIHPDLRPYDGEDFLFEPGATFSLEPIRVANNGTIPFDYELTVAKSTDEGFVGDLLDALQFGACVVKKGEERKKPDEISWQNSFEDLRVQDRLDGKSESDDIYIMIHMKESAGNEFMDKELCGLVIMVRAFQTDMPEDSR